MPTDMELAARARRELLSRRSRGIGDARWVASTYREIDSAVAVKEAGTLAETALLRQAGDTWQIVHLHWSVDAKRLATP